MGKYSSDRDTLQFIGGCHFIYPYCKYANRYFWVRGYFMDTVGRNKKQIQEYIKQQLETDQIADQMSLKEFIDPFTGSKNTKA